MLVNEKYELIASALTKAAADIEFIIEQEGQMTPAQYAYVPDVSRGQRLQRYNTQLENLFADLHVSSHGHKDTFEGRLKKIIEGDSFEAQQDRRYFLEFHADAVTREKFFSAMDDIIAANDNFYNPQAMDLLKEELSASESINRKTITLAVAKAAGDDREMAQEFSTKLIEMWLVTSGQKMSTEAQAAIIAEQAAYTASKIAASVRRLAYAA